MRLALIRMTGDLSALSKIAALYIEQAALEQNEMKATRSVKPLRAVIDEAGEGIKTARRAASDWRAATDRMCDPTPVGSYAI